MWAGWRAELESGDPEEREQAAGRLGALGGDAKQAAPMLARHVREDPEDSVRLTACWSLGKIGDDQDKVVNALIDALAQGESIRDAASKALRRIKGKRVPQILASRLPREDAPAVRVSICYVAASMGRRAASASGALAKAAQSDENERVRSAALHALSHMGPAAYRHRATLRTAMRDPAPHTRLRAVLALRATIGEIYLAPAISLVDHEDPSVRLLAVRAIAGAGEQGVVAAKALEGRLDDPQADIADLAAKTLAKLPG